MPTNGDRVQIYWNLHRDCFSVMALSGPHKGRVVAHTDSFDLTDATFVVRPAGRQRVLREQRKNVHAFIKGTWTTTAIRTGSKVRYNPYEAGHFIADGNPIHQATAAHGETTNGRPAIYATV